MRPSNFDNVLRKLKQTWSLCAGCLIGLVEAGLFLSPLVLPFVAVALMVVVWAFGTYNLRHRDVNCSLMTHYTFYSLLLSAVVMLVINILNTNMAAEWWPTLSQMDIKYITSLVVFPCATLCFAIAMSRRGRSEYCQACKAKAGFSLHDALERNVFHLESRLQIITAFILNMLLAIVGWGYFFLFYDDVSFNSADSFYFYMIPFLVYVLSVAYFITREWNMKFELNINIGQRIEGMHTLVRFMVVRGDRILLNEITLSDGDKLGLWDTPAIVEMSLVEEVTLEDAREMFARNAAIDAKDFDIRFLFNNNTVNSNSFHFVVFLPEDDDPEGLHGEWFTLYEIDIMLKSGQISRPFAVEMHRIYTITMTWKTYDREGRRLYPIKHYRPTFRLADFPTWDVDYNDLSWINVSKNNEDKPFFRLRSWWRRYVSGIENKWRRIS